MIIVLKPKTSEKDIKHVVDKVEKMGLKAHISKGVERTVIGAIGDESLIREDQLKAIPSVDKVMPILKPYKLVSREFKKEDTIIEIGDVSIGGKQIVMMAGPCSIESKEQLLKTAKAIK
jgi:3-deoxy-7-phosphoheptulonate synthase